MTKILVVDDESSIRDLIEMILKRENFTVITAKTGLEAVEKFKSNLPELIILDLMLPDISGHDVMKKVNSIKKVPIIMLTAKSDIIDKVLGLELGADDYITKPFDGRELVARIKAVLRRLNKFDDEEGQKTIKFLNIEINLENKTVMKKGQF